MKKIILGFFLLAVAGVETNAKPMAILENSLTSSRTLTTDSCYVLRGVYVVTNNAVLTIDPGVEILCEAASSLVVTQGSQFFSNGTSALPVVFSPRQNPGSRTPGFWAGILINGKAKNNIVNGGGGTYSIDRGGVSFPGGGILDNDNSGNITYTQILYAGAGSIGDEETHGLVLNGVGSGTSIDHVQVAYSSLDGIALFGGTVDLSNAYVLNAYRNDLFLNLGYTGEMSGILTMRKDAVAHHTAGSNGMLVWNNEDNPTNTPLTQPEVLNCTFIGPEHCNSGSLSSDFKDGISFDNNGGGNFYNNVITGFKNHALYITDAQSAARTAIDELNFSYNSMTNNGSGDYAYGAFTWSTYGCSSSMSAWITGPVINGCEEAGNQFSSFLLGYDDSFCADYCDIDFVQNFVLTESTELNAPDPITSLYDDRGAVQFADSFIWVTVCPQNKVYCSPEMEKETKEKKSGLIIVPNPAQSQANLMFEAKTLGFAKVLILDKVTGRVLFQKNVSIKYIGEQKISISVKGLREGVYPIRVQMKNSVINSLISVQ